MRIRPVEHKDIPDVVAMGAQMHGESLYASLDFDPDKLVDLAQQVIAYPSAYWGVVIEHEGALIGVGAAYAVEHWFGHDLTSGDLAMYVLPEHRGGMAGVKLVKSYIEWAKLKGVKEPCLGVSAGINPGRIGALYQRLGFTDVYSIYKMPDKS